METRRGDGSGSRESIFGGMHRGLTQGLDWAWKVREPWCVSCRDEYIIIGRWRPTATVVVAGSRSGINRGSNSISSPGRKTASIYHVCVKHVRGRGTTTVMGNIIPANIWHPGTHTDWKLLTTSTGRVRTAAVVKFTFFLKIFGTAAVPTLLGTSYSEFRVGNFFEVRKGFTCSKAWTPFGGVSSCGLVPSSQ